MKNSLCLYKRSWVLLTYIHNMAKSTWASMEPKVFHTNLGKPCLYKDLTLCIGALSFRNSFGCLSSSERKRMPPFYKHTIVSRMSLYGAAIILFYTRTKSPKPGMTMPLCTKWNLFSGLHRALISTVLISFWMNWNDGCSLGLLSRHQCPISCGWMGTNAHSHIPKSTGKCSQKKGGCYNRKGETTQY